MSLPPKDSRQFRIDEKGRLRVPKDVLDEAGLGPKMRVHFRVDGKRIVIEKVAGEANPLDGPLGRKLDKDLFGKIQVQQREHREKTRDLFEKGIEEAANDPDPEPPDHPFRWD